jgi:hypothetical protein
MIPNAHLCGQGCSKCRYENVSKRFTMTFNEFIDKANKIHKNKYDYSLVSLNLQNKIKIICPIHGIFEQKPGSHLFGQGCPTCGGSKKLNKEFFIKSSIKIHGNKYDYSLVDYKNNRTAVEIICPKHGVFKQTAKKHITRKQGCPMCRNSKGENILFNLFTKNKIKFTPQKKFSECKSINLLPFDFYLDEFNCCIEFHGLQHFQSIKVFGAEEKFIYLQRKDKIKDKYCENNNISLLIIFDKCTEFKKLYFVDLFNNTNEYIKNIIINKNNMSQVTPEEYNDFKSSF